jgi:hypothetical protein
MYYQQQQGGLCRMHALNAYYKQDKYSEVDFKHLCIEYDLFMKKVGYNIESSIESFDLFESNQNTIISFALYKTGIYSLLIPFGYLEQYLHMRHKHRLSDLVNNNFIFIFNEGHVWAAGVHENKWYNIDSLNGIRPIDINMYNGKKHGFVIPRTQSMTIEDLKWNIAKLKLYLIEHNTPILSSDIIQLLERLHNDKLLLDDMEIYIANTIHILRLINGVSHNIEFHIILHDYDAFLYIFERERLNINNIIRYIPSIIERLCELDLEQFEITDL